MSDWIDCKPSQADEISRRLRNKEFDTETYAVRIRRYPKERHLNDVITDTGGVW
tara:strand:- start:205 stop:366 length:162 start_codon:yes stop_codon:yes gene_type:complete